MMSRTVSRGSRLEYGSWKIICIAAPQRPQRGAIERRDVVRRRTDIAAGGLKQAQDGAADRGLATAEFADQTDHLAAREREG